MLETLPPPPVGHHPSNAMWVDEQIWGHRLWDSTTPWLNFLEFLGVAEARDHEGDLFGPGGSPYPLVFKPAQRMFARNGFAHAMSAEEVRKDVLAAVGYKAYEIGSYKGPPNLPTDPKQPEDGDAMHGGGRIPTCRNV